MHSLHCCGSWGSAGKGSDHRVSNRRARTSWPDSNQDSPLAGPRGPDCFGRIPWNHVLKILGCFPLGRWEFLRVGSGSSWFCGTAMNEKTVVLWWCPWPHGTNVNPDRRAGGLEGFTFSSPLWRSS
jgi:hypothetical protein